MSLIYSSTYQLENAPVGPTAPTDENLEPPAVPIPGLSTLKIPNTFLAGGGTIFINLFLGQAYTSFDNGYLINVSFIDLNSFQNTEPFYEAVFGNMEIDGIHTYNQNLPVSISAIYDLPPDCAAPEIQANWRCENNAVLFPQLTTFAFTAQVSPAIVSS